jgi:hypothetical protein
VPRCVRGVVVSGPPSRVRCSACQSALMCCSDLRFPLLTEPDSVAITPSAITHSTAHSHTPTDVTWCGSHNLPSHHPFPPHRARSLNPVAHEPPVSHVPEPAHDLGRVHAGVDGQLAIGAAWVLSERVPYPLTVRFACAGSRVRCDGITGRARVALPGLGVDGGGE